MVLHGGASPVILSTNAPIRRTLPTLSASASKPPTRRFSPVLPGWIGWPCCCNLRITRSSMMHTARVGPP